MNSGMMRVHVICGNDWADVSLADQDRDIRPFPAHFLTCIKAK